MNTDIHSEPPMNQLPEAAKEIARRAADAAKETAHRATAIGEDVTGLIKDVADDVTEATKDTTKDTTKCATDTARDLYHSAALKAEETLATSKEYVRRNPVPVVLGAVAFGAALGYILIMARRKPTFSECYADEPLSAVREAILGALAPVAQRAHEGYDSARDGAGKVLDRVHSLGPGHTRDSFSEQIGRIGNNLKFW